MGRIIMQAKIQGMNEYNENEGKDEVLAQELALIDGVREDTSLNDSYWDAGYTLGQAFSKGRTAGMADSTIRAVHGGDGDDGQETFWGIVNSTIGKNAWGLDRVPYDNYLTYLHEGERVLTASQARAMDQGGSAPNISVTVSGNTFGAGMDETAVAEAIADTAVRKILAGYRG